MKNIKERPENNKMRDLTQYIPLLEDISEAFPLRFRDDLIQEGFLVLVRADELYDPDKGASFKTYVSRAVFRRMRTFVEKFSKNISLDNTLRDEDGESTTYADLLEDESDLQTQIGNRDYYTKNIEQASQIERFIKKRYYEDGFTEKEILELYKELHMINSIRTIRKILKK
jgi:RNA polymerase sporulation-specific sigma factor